MKLIYCKECCDIVKLNLLRSTCNCGECWGIYLNDLVSAVIHGPAIPLGIDNLSFIEALKERHVKGLGKEFTAFVIPEECDTVVKEV